MTNDSRGVTSTWQRSYQVLGQWEALCFGEASQAEHTTKTVSLSNLQFATATGMGRPVRESCGLFQCLAPRPISPDDALRHPCEVHGMSIPIGVELTRRIRATTCRPARSTRISETLLRDGEK
jgi:hypothetical protein